MKKKRGESCTVENFQRYVFVPFLLQKLQKIYDKDGKDGLLRYAGVVMRRSVHSTKSPYYYKYKKYYENISWNYTATAGVKPYRNIPNEAPDIKWQYLEKIDEIVEKLLEKAEVAVVQGSAFGLDGYFRISYATSMDNLKKALDRIKFFCESLN